MKYLGSKTLETDRLVLHKTEEKDLKTLWRILLNEEVSRYYLVAKIKKTWEEEKIWQYKKLANAGNDDIFTWTIEIKSTNEVIGQISFLETDKEKNIYDLGWFIDVPYQKKGYAYEAAKTAIKYMFLEVEIERLETCICKKNPNSFHLAEKLGFKRQNSTKMIKYTFLDHNEECMCYILEKNTFLKECFRKESLYITENIDKDPYIKHLTDDHILNITGESGSGKTTATIPYQSDDNVIIIDTDNIFKDENKNRDEEKLYKYLKNKYEKLPNLSENFDIIYQDILECFKLDNRLLIIDSAQYRNTKDISILKGDIIVIRTCINNCFDRCIKKYEKNNPNATFEEKSEYIARKKNIYKWYHHLNSFIDKLDREEE